MDFKEKLEHNLWLILSQISQQDFSKLKQYADGSGYSVIAPLWKSPIEQSDLSVLFHVTRQESEGVISIQDVHIL